MFSLVTALVSPNIIEALRGKKETLLSTLTENASVLCFQPNDSICLLQGEWENVKKAYAILEEFYFRAQAEVMVREMLKGNLHQMASSAHFPKKEHGMDVANWSNPLLSSILPLSEKSGNLPSMQLSKGFASDKARMRYDSDFSTMQENLNSQPPGSVKDFVTRDERCGENTDAERADTTTVGDGQNSNHHEDGVLEDDDDDDEDPPVLLKEGPCGADVISLSSEMSDAKEMDFCDGSHLLSEGHSSASSYERVLKGLLGSLENVDEAGNRTERRHKFQNFGVLPRSDDVEIEPPELTESHSLETFVSELGKKADQTATRNAVMSVKNSEHSTSMSSSSLATIGSSAAFHAQQYLTDRLAAGRKLPQFSSLLLGSAALSQSIPAWHQYAGDLYGLHLSALQHSMHVKQEPVPLISSSDLAPVPALGEDDFKGGLGYRFEDDAALQEMRCARCGKTYRSEARMKEHIRTHDKDYVPVLHSCPKCGKSFTYRHNMVVHLRRFHYGWQPAKRHVCKMCGIRFQKPYLLRLHEHKAHLMPA